jgi:hypothetical protein
VRHTEALFVDTQAILYPLLGLSPSVVYFVVLFQLLGIYKVSHNYLLNSIPTIDFRGKSIDIKFGMQAIRKTNVSASSANNRGIGHSTASQLKERNGGC